MEGGGGESVWRTSHDAWRRGEGRREVREGRSRSCGLHSLVLVSRESRDAMHHHRWPLIVHICLFPQSTCLPGTLPLPKYSWIKPCGCCSKQLIWFKCT